MNILAIALAGGVGAALRYWLDAAIPTRSRIPWSTLFINLTGSALIGLLVGLDTIPEPWQAVLTVGLLGGYTTFSTATVQTAELLLTGEPRPAIGYAAGMLAGSVALAALGLWAGHYAAGLLMY